MAEKKNKYRFFIRFPNTEEGSVAAEFVHKHIRDGHFADFISELIYASLSDRPYTPDVEWLYMKNKAAPDELRRGYLFTLSKDEKGKTVSDYLNNNVGPRQKGSYIVDIINKYVRSRSPES